MRALVWWPLFGLLFPSWAAAQIPLADVTVLGSPARVLQFQAVASLERVELKPGALRLDVRHATPWPMVSIDGGEPSQAGTLWVFLRISGRWWAAGAERLRPQQLDGVDKPESADVNAWIGTDWLYDAGRWGPMAGYVPAKGELVGLMVAAGSSRSDDQAPVQERTRVIQFAWPGPGGSADIRPTWVEGQSPPAEPGPPLPPVPAPTVPPVDLSAILSRLDALEALVAAVDARQMGRWVAVEKRVSAVEARTVPMSCSASANLGFARVPVSCRLD